MLPSLGLGRVPEMKLSAKHHREKSYLFEKSLEQVILPYFLGFLGDTLNTAASELIIALTGTTVITLQTVHLKMSSVVVCLVAL